MISNNQPNDIFLINKVLSNGKFNCLIASRKKNHSFHTALLFKH